MDHLKMSMDISESSSSFPVDGFPGGVSAFSSSDSMGMSSLDPASSAGPYGFTDPAILTQLSELENGVDVKYPLQGGIPPNATYNTPPPQHQHHPGSAHALSMQPVSTWLGESKPIATPENLPQTSPPSSHSSGHSPPRMLSQAQSLAHTPSGIDTSAVSTSISSVSSPISPPPGHGLITGAAAGPTTATGVPLAGIVPQRDGSQVTVGGLVAGVLDNIVQMASQARDAYLAGKQDLTHLQIEEMLESLKLVGGLGVGPSIGTVHSNRSLTEGEEVANGSASGREGSRSRSQATGIMEVMSGPGGSSSHSPQSSVSPPQRGPATLPLPGLTDPSALNQITSSTLANTPSPPMTAAPTSLAAAVDTLSAVMDNSPSGLPMAQAPSSATFDKHRKRATASAPDLSDAIRGPHKFTKMTPPLADDFASGSPINGVNPLAASPANMSILPPNVMSGPPVPPPLLHAHTFPSLATQQTPMPMSGMPPPLPTLYSQPPTATGSSTSLTPVPMSNVLHATTTPWPIDAPSSSMVIPPPHTTPPEQHFTAQDLANVTGYPPMGGFAPSNGALDSQLNGSPPQLHDLVGPPPPDLAALARSASAMGGMMDLDQMSGVGMMPVGVGAGMPVGPPPVPFDPSMAIHSPMDISFPPVVPPQQQQPSSRPGTSHGRSSLGNSVSKSESQGRQSSPDGSDDENDDDGDSDDGDDEGAPGSSNGHANSGSGKDSNAKPKRRGKKRAGASDANNPANALSPELKTQVDRIFMEYLNRVCSNLDATDAKGEAIHQTLMAKKMARLDESPDFRPFKFRIQAFTNGFVEELARQGFDDDVIPIKKTKAYLWHHTPYIARFNEDGKKAKSKGNHIWNIEAKKVSASSDGPRWLFKQFSRKIAGAPPGMAYIGLKWSWEPKIWDPQLSRASIDVQFSSPNMPSWMRWEKGALLGTPTPDSQSFELIVEAKFQQDGQDRVLRVQHPITVAPLAVGDSSFPKARRPSLLSNEGVNARRFVSDTVVQQALPPRVPVMAAPTLPPPAPSAAETAQVIAVINSAANRVAQEAQTQNVANPGPAQAHAQASLAKQQHVLEVTAQVISTEAHNALVGRSIGEQPKAASVLVQAAQAVVHQAARQLQADKTAVAILQSKNGPAQAPIAPPSVSLTDVSIATQSAVAHAVAITGSQSSEVEVMLTANSLIQQRSRADSRAGMIPATLAPQPAPPNPYAVPLVPQSSFMR